MYLYTFRDPNQSLKEKEKLRLLLIYFFFFSRPTDVRRVNREEMLHARAYQRDRQISMPCVPPAAA